MSSTPRPRIPSTSRGCRTETCTTDECTITVAPGDYTLGFEKTGYKSVTESATVPLGKPYEDTVNFDFIPVIGQTDKTADETFPPQPQLTPAEREKLGIGASTQLFFNDSGKAVCYIVRNPQNYRQTLYLASISDAGDLGEPQIVTSFLRDLQHYVVIPSSDANKVAIIDQGADQSTLYLVDRQAQNRASLFTYPFIRDLRWIPGTYDFLFAARAQSDSTESVFLYRGDDGKTTQLDLKTPLDDVAIVNRNRLLAVTNQKLPDTADMKTLEGQLVPLGENQSTVEVSVAVNAAEAAGATPPQVTPTYSFVDFSLVANQARLITIITTDPFPSKVTASQDGKSLYYLQGDKVFQLRFAE